MITTKLLTDVERKLRVSHPECWGIAAIAFADFGNGYGLFYGLVGDISGDFVPFTMRHGRDDLRLWPQLRSDDPGLASLVSLIDRLMNTTDDPHA